MECLKRIRYRAGRCYELAYRVMLREPGAQAFSLVHGRISQVKGCKDTLIDHAWIELGDQAIERLRRHLWSEFFGEMLCPERGDRNVPISNGDTQ
jgi:hypothetical protein